MHCPLRPIKKLTARATNIYNYESLGSKKNNMIEMTGIRHSGGFTLVEIVVNIAIIGILAAIAIPAYTIFKDKANTAKAKSDLRAIQNAIELLASDTEKWPGPNSVGVTANQEVWDLNSSDAGLVTATSGFPNWNGPYVSAVAKDPWGSDYFFDPDYKIGGDNYAVVGSFGPNKVGKNKYDSDDVYLILPTQ